MSGYLLGLDNGSTVIKAAVFDLEGNEIAVVRESAEMLSPYKGHYQRDLEDVKIGNFNVIKAALKKSGVKGDEILGVAITGHGNGAYFIDSMGNPAFDGISSADSRAADIVNKWYADGTASEVLKYTLQSLWAGQTPAIIAWFKENLPEVLEKAQWVMMAKDYVRYLLTGEVFVEYTDVSGTSLYNVREGCYDERILSALGIAEYRRLLPEVKSPCEVCGRITHEVAAQTGLTEGTPVAGGLFDIQAATLATGIVEVTEKPKLNIVVGTWSINQYLTKNPTEDKDLFMTSIYAHPGSWLIMEGSATSASNLEWYVNTFLQLEKVIAKYEGRSVYDICNKEVAEITPEESDIVFLPFLYGSNVKADINGCFLNLRMRHKRGHVVRALYEGIVFSHKYHIDKLFKTYPEGLEVVLAGGGANSPVWVQMFADVLQLPIETTIVDELGALGAAMCAGVSVGAFSDLKESAQRMVKVKDRYEPNPDFAEIYMEKYERYLSYIDKLSS